MAAAENIKLMLRSRLTAVGGSGRVEWLEITNEDNGAKQKIRDDGCGIFVYPGTQAAVTNSGTENNAVLDFTIPQGAAGTNPPVQLLSAYSIPAQAGTTSTPLVFDRTGVSYGTAAEHTANSPDFTITQPGVYTLAFSGSFAPGNGAAFPLNVGITAQLGGTDIPGASAQHTFQSASDVANLSFTVPFTVTTAPAALQVVGAGTSFLYSALSAAITRNGDIPTT